MELFGGREGIEGLHCGLHSDIVHRESFLVTSALEPFLRKSEFIFLFLMWTALNFKRSVNWFQRYIRQQSHTDTHTETFSLNLVFRTWEWYQLKIHQNLWIKIFMIALLSSLLVSPRSNNVKFWNLLWDFSHFYFDKLDSIRNLKWRKVSSQLQS